MFKVKSLDHLKICFFINDELIKFYSIKDIAFKIYQWFQSKTASIEEYSESLMISVMKMFLTFDMYIGKQYFSDVSQFF